MKNKQIILLKARQTGKSYSTLHEMIRRYKEVDTEMRRAFRIQSVKKIFNI